MQQLNSCFTYLLFACLLFGNTARGKMYFKGIYFMFDCLERTDCSWTMSRGELISRSNLSTLCAGESPIDVKKLNSITPGATMAVSKPRVDQLTVWKVEWSDFRLLAKFCKLWWLRQCRCQWQSWFLWPTLMLIFVAWGQANNSTIQEDNYCCYISSS